MFSVVIWATDGSEAADLALPLARYLVAESGGQLVVVHCPERCAAAGRAEAASAIRKIEAQVEGLRRDGVDVALHIEAGHAAGVAQAIVELAAAEEADVITVGTLGRNPLGSVAQRLLQLAACPVLAVPVAQPATPDSAAVGRHSRRPSTVAG